MNNKTLFSQDKKFLELWRSYTKGIKEILHMRYVPHYWYILSDYCFCLIKISHHLPQLLPYAHLLHRPILQNHLSRNKFKDLKQMTNIPDEVLKQ